MVDSCGESGCPNVAEYTVGVRHRLRFCAKHMGKVTDYGFKLQDLIHLSEIPTKISATDTAFEERIKQEIRKGGGKLIVNYKTKEIRRVK